MLTLERDASTSCLLRGSEWARSFARRAVCIKSYTPESADATELLSIMELHRRMGHIAVASARKLVESGAVTGINLDPSSEEHDCDTCIFVHATRVAMLGFELAQIICVWSTRNCLI